MTLKPCPFCGKEVRRGSDESKDHINAFWCEECLCEFTIRQQERQDYYVNWWNLRANQSEINDWIEKTEVQIVNNNEIIEYANSVSSCDWSYYSQSQREASNAKNLNKLLNQAINLLKGKTNV